MSRSLLILAFLLGLAAPALAADRPVFNDRQLADLRRVSGYLNSGRSLTGRFIQVAPDGTPSKGTFYLQRPGRLRFEFDKPNPVLVIADGAALVVQNTALRTTQRYPLFGNPLSMLLSDDVNLGEDERISRVSREAGVLSVTARQDSGPAQGQITLIFSDSGGTLELRQWEVIDAQQLRTIVMVSELQTGVEIPPGLFVVRRLGPSQTSPYQGSQRTRGSQQ